MRVNELFLSFTKYFLLKAKLLEINVPMLSD